MHCIALNGEDTGLEMGKRIILGIFLILFKWNED